MGLSDSPPPADLVDAQVPHPRVARAAGMPPGPPAIAPPVPELTEAHFALLRDSARLRRPGARAARVARGSAVTTLVIAALAIPFLLIDPGWVGLVIVAGLFTAGIVELVASRKLREGDPDAARTLGSNQLFLFAVISFYCVVQMVSFARADLDDLVMSPEMRGQIGYLPELGSLEKQADAILPLVVYGFYALVIVASAAFQGGLAIYYFSRRKYLAAARQEMPTWVQRVIAEVAG